MIKGYKTSKDYKHLKVLLDKGLKVVSFITYDANAHENYNKPLMVTDICWAYMDSGWYYISARGISYCTYWSEMHRYKSFEDMCDRNNIEFIEPNV